MNSKQPGNVDIFKLNSIDFLTAFNMEQFKWFENPNEIMSWKIQWNTDLKRNSIIFLNIFAWIQRKKKLSERLRINGHFNENFCVNKSDCNHSLVDLVDGINLMPQLTKIVRKTLVNAHVEWRPWMQNEKKKTDDLIKKRRKNKHCATELNVYFKLNTKKKKRKPNERDSIGNIVS